MPRLSASSVSGWSRAEPRASLHRRSCRITPDLLKGKTMATLTREHIQVLLDQPGGRGMVVSCYADTSVAEGFKAHWLQPFKTEAGRIRQLMAGDHQARLEFERDLEAIRRALESPEASPCLGSVDVTPWQVRLEFPDCHYITVSSPLRGVGGFNSVSFRAFRTRRASGQPPLTPRRSGRSSMRNVTKRTVCSASIARSAEKSIPASSSRRPRSRCTNSARAATKICAFTRASI